MSTSFRTRSVALLALLAVSASLAACSTPPWATPDPSATPGASVSPAQPVPNDLSTGATARTLTTGPLTANINYWSTLSMDKWTPAALKPVSLSLITKLTPSDGQKAYLQRATMIATPGSATQTFDPLSPQVDTSTTNPGYLVLDPYSYSQTFTVGQTPVGAAFVTLDFTYEFLIQSTPTSSEYAKQTATDTITVALTQ